MVAGGPVWNVGILPIPAIFLKEDRKRIEDPVLIEETAGTGEAERTGEIPRC